MKTDEHPADPTRAELVRRLSAYADECGIGACELLDALRAFISAADMPVTTKASRDALMHLVRDLGFRTRRASLGYVPIATALRGYPDIATADFVR